MRTSIFVLFALVALTTAAHAQPVTIGLNLVDGPGTAPPRITVDDSFNPTAQIVLDYQLANGAYRDVLFTLDLPPWVSPVLSSHGDFVHNNCPLSAGAGSVRTCTWTKASLALKDQGISGTINLTLSLARWRFLEDQPVPFSAIATGFRTPQGGIEASFTTPAATYAAVADPIQGFGWQSGTFFGPIGWVERNDGGTVENGLLLQMGLRFTTGFPASAKLLGVSLTSELGAGLEVLGVTHQSLWSHTGPTADVGGTTTIGYTYLDDAPPTFTDSHYDSHTILVDVFVPCSAFVTGATGPDYGIENDVVWFERIYEADGTPRDELRTATLSQNMPAVSGQCGQGGLLNKATELWWPAPEDGWGLTGINVSPPTGVASATNVIIVDHLPPGVAFRSFHTRTPSQFTFYGCNFPSPGLAEQDDLTIAQLTANLQYCTDLVLSPPASPLPVTHLIATAAVWGGPVPLASFSMRYETYIPVGYLATHPASTVNKAYAKFDYTLGGQAFQVSHSDLLTMEADPWKDDALVTVNVNGGSCPAPWGAIEGLSALAPRSPPSHRGVAVFRPNAANAEARLLNPKLTVTLPPGVTAISAQIVNVENQKCPNLTLTSSPSGFPKTGPLVWQWTGLEPHVGPGGRCWDVKVTIEAAPEGWINGESFDIVGVLDAENERAGCPGIFTNTFTVSVPAELQVQVVPSCQGNLGEPAFDVATRNHGGIDFTSGHTTFSVPASTEVTGVAFPPGVTGQCRIGGALVTCPADPAQLMLATEVHASGFDLDAPDEEVTFRVNLGTTLAELSPIVATATATVTQLGAPASSGPSQPFVVDDCHYEIAVTKLFDDDGNGAVSGGDYPLAAWPFTLVPAGGGAPIVDQTDIDGVARFLVRPGDYVVSEALPANANGQVWNARSGLSQPVTLVVDPQTPTTLTFLNGCSCQPFACTALAGTCAPDGCDYLASPDCDTAAVYYVPLRGPGGDTVVACTLNSLAQPPTLICQPPSAATVTQCGGGPQE